jgi:predicted phage terminase large subunit-like protein
VKAAALLGTLSRELLQAELCRRSFLEFVRRFWPVVTGLPLVENGATKALVSALQDVADGKVTRLLVALPPGTGKSTVLALYAAWRLARKPEWRSIHASHSFEIARTESLRVRRLIESDAYKAFFPMQLRDDESTAAHWATTKDGRYIAVGTDGALTGRRAHESVLDDPLNAPDRFSKAARDTLWAWFQEALSTRLDGDRAPIIVVQQRLDRDDLIGRLIEQGGWTLLELPAEAEDGTLLAPNVLSREKLDALKLQVGSATYACQYLQRPSDDSSATIKRSWWRFHHAPHVALNAPRPSGCELATPAPLTPDRFERIVIACDLTFGSVKGDYACAQVWGGLGAARYLLAMWRRRAGLLESVQAIRVMAADYPNARIIIERAANGAGAIEELAAAGLSRVIAVKPLGSKAERLGMVSATIEAGNCYLPLGTGWLADFVEELAGATKHDDMQDAAAYAIHDLNSSAAQLSSSVHLERGPYARGRRHVRTDEWGRPLPKGARA